MSTAELLHQLSRLGVVATATPDGFLDLEPAEILTPELLETIKAHKAEILEHLEGLHLESLNPQPRAPKRSPAKIATTGSLERLPWQLENLIRAASSDTLPTSAKLEDGIVPDLNRYVLAWASAYLLRSPDAVTRLWAVWHVWRAQIEKVLN